MVKILRENANIDDDIYRTYTYKNHIILCGVRCDSDINVLDIPYGVTLVAMSSDRPPNNSVAEIRMPDTVISVSGFDSYFKLKKVKLSKNLKRLEAFAFY